MQVLSVRGCAFLSSVLFVLGPGVTRAAQEPAQVATATTGSVSGLVLAADGARLPLATVRLVGDAGAAVFSTVSGGLGTYRVAGVPPGRYDLSVAAAGFATATRAGVVVAAGAALAIDVRLDVAAVVEEATVVGRAREAGGLETPAIRESGARDVGEALTAGAGVWKVRKGAIANDVVLRGLQGRDVTVVVDGERIHGACPNRMDPAAFHVDFAEVERVEVTKGPLDVRSAGALGGTVNVVTRRPQAGWHALPAFGAGSAGYLSPSATVSYGGGRVAALAGFSYRRADAYEDGSGRRFTELTNYRASAVSSDAFRAATGWTRVGWTPGVHRLELAWTRQQADHVLYPYLQMDAVYDDADRLGLRYERADGDGAVTALSAQAYVTWVDHWMTDEYRTSSASMPRAYSMGTDADTRTWGGKLQASVFRTTALGAEAFRREWDASTLLAGRLYRPQASIPGVTIDTAGLFAEHSRPLGATATLTAGGRVDYVASAADAGKANTNLYAAYHATRTTSRRDVLPSGKVRLAWRPSGPLEITGGVGVTSRVAEGNERFFALQRMGSDWVGNPDLEPSRNVGADVQATWSRLGRAVTLSGFVNRVHDFITVYDQPRVQALPGVMNTHARSYANVDARLWGVEAEVSVPLSNRLLLAGDLSYVRGTVTPRPELGIETTDLAEMPPLRGRVRARLDDGLVFAMIEGVFVADQDHVDTDLREPRTPGYGTANVTAGVKRGRLSATVGLANVFDRLYAEHLSYQRDPFRSGVVVPEPGRTLFVNVSVAF